MKAWDQGLYVTYTLYNCTVFPLLPLSSPPPSFPPPSSPPPSPSSPLASLPFRLSTYQTSPRHCLYSVVCPCGSRHGCVVVVLVSGTDTPSAQAGWVSRLGSGYGVWSQMDRNGRWPLQHCDDFVKELRLRNSWLYTEGGRVGGWKGGRVGGWEGGYGRIGECMEDECVRCVNAWWGRGEKCV